MCVTNATAPNRHAARRVKRKVSAAGSRVQRTKITSAGRKTANVKDWRKANPGYWRKKKSSTQVPLQDFFQAQVAHNEELIPRVNSDALQDLFSMQPAVVVGLISLHLAPVVQSYAALLGPDHRKTLGAMECLAVTMCAQGDLTGARNLQEQVLEGFRRAPGPKHPNTLQAMQFLARIVEAQEAQHGKQQVVVDGRTFQTPSLRKYVLPKLLRLGLLCGVSVAGMYPRRWCERFPTPPSPPRFAAEIGVCHRAHPRSAAAALTIESLPPLNHEKRRHG
jgi:hypothetical protein